ncbi:MAG: YggS family pyridoxal phosphate-dependent enzyme [Verrucomicrobia bacterium]|nr:YggS family pyridoxal phosphate-dependent enzyme [Verrucomicrobiota bacterium]
MDFASNLKHIKDRITAACRRCGRDPASVELMAVSKNVSPEKISEAAEAGQTLFGENRVQEAKAKIGRCPGHLQWHMIGHLQTNKCRDAIELFDTIQSLDSLKLAREIDKTAAKLSKSVPVLIEVNVAGESSKHGFSPGDLIAELKQLEEFPNIEIHGLMTIAPWTNNPERLRPMFKGLRELKFRCEDIIGAPLPQLSMGMTNDFEIAIEEGSTMIRVGTALFGERPVKDD